MKKTVLLLGFAFLASLVVEVYAAEKSVTLEGTLVDSKCYLMDTKFAGNDHGTVKHCGTLCLKGGTPGALLTNDKKFYPILAPSLVLAPYVGQTIRVTGTIVSGAISADKVEINKNGKWQALDLGPMM